MENSSFINEQFDGVVPGGGVLINGVHCTSLHQPTKPTGSGVATFPTSGGLEFAVETNIKANFKESSEMSLGGIFSMDQVVQKKKKKNHQPSNFVMDCTKNSNFQMEDIQKKKKKSFLPRRPSTLRPPPPPLPFATFPTTTTTATPSPPPLSNPSVQHQDFKRERVMLKSSEKKRKAEEEGEGEKEEKTTTRERVMSSKAPPTKSTTPSPIRLD